MAASTPPTSPRLREPPTHSQADFSLGPYPVHQVPSRTPSTFPFFESEGNSQNDLHTLIEDAALATVQRDDVFISPPKV